MISNSFKIIFFIGLLWLFPGMIQAQDELVCERDVVVQVDDWLSKISEKFYGDTLAFPAIFEATNTKALQDESYAVIDDPDLIEPGWKLCIVNVAAAEEILGFTLDLAPLADDSPINLKGPIKVGAAHALSGPFAAQGQSIRQGIELAVREVNEGEFLGEGTLQLVWEDTGGDPAQAVDAFKRLIEEAQVVAILGPTLSQSAFAANPLAQAASVPVIGSSNTAQGVTDIGSYIFSTSLTEEQIVAVIVRQTKEAFNLEEVVMLYDPVDPFTLVGREIFQQALSDEAVKISTSFPLASGERDFSAQLAEIQALEPDALILSLLPEEAVPFILQAQQQGLADIPIIGGSSLNTPRLFDLSHELPEGIISGAAWNGTNSSGSTREFVTRYEAEYGTPPDQFAAQAYTALWALATALRQADSTERPAIREALDGMAQIESPLGLFTFDERRNPDHQPVVQISSGETFILFK